VAVFFWTEQYNRAYLGHNSGVLVCVGLDLVYVGLDLVCVGLDLVYVGLDLVCVGLDLVCVGLDLVYVGLDLVCVGLCRNSWTMY